MTTSKTKITYLKPNDTTNDTTYGVAYSRGDLLGWVAPYGENEETDAFLEGTYPSKQLALAAMYADME
jgi:hypothetical protein